MNVVFDGNLGWLYVFFHRDVCVCFIGRMRLFHRAYAIRPHAVMCMASYILSVKTEYPDPVRKS